MTATPEQYRPQRVEDLLHHPVHHPDMARSVDKLDPQGRDPTDMDTQMAFSENRVRGIRRGKRSMNRYGLRN